MSGSHVNHLIFRVLTPGNWPFGQSFSRPFWKVLPFPVSFLETSLCLPFKSIIKGLPNSNTEWSLCFLPAFSFYSNGRGRSNGRGSPTSNSIPTSSEIQLVGSMVLSIGDAWGIWSPSGTSAQVPREVLLVSAMHLGHLYSPSEWIHRELVPWIDILYLLSILWVWSLVLSIVEEWRVLIHRVGVPVC